MKEKNTYNTMIRSIHTCYTNIKVLIYKYVYSVTLIIVRQTKPYIASKIDSSTKVLLGSISPTSGIVNASWCSFLAAKMPGYHQPK